MPDDKKTIAPPGLSLDGVPPEIHEEMIKLFRQNNMPPGPGEAEAAAVQMGDAAGTALLGGLMGGEQQSPAGEQPPPQEQPQATPQTGTTPFGNILKNVDTYNGKNSKGAQTIAGAVDAGDARQNAEAEGSYWSDNAVSLTQIALAALLGTIGAKNKSLAYFPFAQAIGGLGTRGIQDWYREQDQKREARLEGLMSPQDTVKRGSQLWDESKNALQLNAHAHYPDDEAKRNQMIQEGLSSLYETMPDKFKEANPDAVAQTFQRMDIAGLGVEGKKALYQAGQADFGTDTMTENVRIGYDVAKKKIAAHLGSSFGSGMREQVASGEIDEDDIFNYLQTSMKGTESWETIKPTLRRRIPQLLQDMVEDMPRPAQDSFDNKAKIAGAKLFNMTLDEAKTSTGTVTKEEIQGIRFLKDAESSLVGSDSGDVVIDNIMTALYDGLGFVHVDVDPSTHIHGPRDKYRLGAQTISITRTPIFLDKTSMNSDKEKDRIWQEFINSDNPMSMLTPEGQEIFRKLLEISD